MRLFRFNIISMIAVFLFLIVSLIADSFGSEISLSIVRQAITPTRYEESIGNIPARVDVITKEEIKQMPVQKIDEVLKNISGVTAERTNGIYSVRPLVTLRGLSGDEQGRTLVLKDGVPLNMADTGDVNWNSINLDEVERIEVFKGPGSSLYGNNAMGGVINIITKKPAKSFEGKVTGGYGTYNTASGKLFLSGRQNDLAKGFYWRASGSIQNSDGYISTPDNKKTQYTVPRFVYEKNGGVKLGYDFNAMRNLELEYSYYDDKRGEGVKIQASDGVVRDFDTANVRARYNDIIGYTKIDINVFHQLEKYSRTSETLRGINYTRFDVASDREDYGFLVNAAYPICGRNTISAGFDGRVGKVNGADFYKTSPDVVANHGTMAIYALYLQDEINTLQDKLKLLAGLRYDSAHFYNGYYHVSNQTSATSAWIKYNNDNLPENTWTAFTPRLSARYFFNDLASVYTSYAQGFRASILDDLCRSGYMWVGPKVANPEIGPEKIDTYELGSNIALTPSVEILPTLYYSRGHQFLYYVATDLPLLNGRTVYRRENVGEVEIYGAEFDVRWEPIDPLAFTAGYTYNKSTILRFDQKPQLENKELTYNPKNQAHLSCDWLNTIVNTYFAVNYKDAQYVSEDNISHVGAYTTVDAKIYKEVGIGITVSLGVQNIFDYRYLESADDMSPGCIVESNVSLKF